MTSQEIISNLNKIADKADSRIEDNANAFSVRDLVETNFSIDWEDYEDEDEDENVEFLKEELKPELEAMIKHLQSMVKAIG